MEYKIKKRMNFLEMNTDIDSIKLFHHRSESINNLKNYKKAMNILKELKSDKKFTMTRKVIMIYNGYNECLVDLNFIDNDTLFEEPVYSEKIYKEILFLKRIK